ncbi:hypothetical protein [Actinomadura madurae]|uniref:hypothetical protein n=1 Tax=Actinomadura madurae TaxID=1993 RepID=UPI003556988C
MANASTSRPTPLRSTSVPTYSQRRSPVTGRGRDSANEIGLEIISILPASAGKASASLSRSTSVTTKKPVHRSRTCSYSSSESGWARTLSRKDACSVTNTRASGRAFSRAVQPPRNPTCAWTTGAGIGSPPSASRSQDACSRARSANV